MGGSLAPKSFPWPSTIGGSQAVNPLNKATAPTLNSTTPPYGGSAPGASGVATPTQPPTSPIVGTPMRPTNPLAPVANPVIGLPRMASAFYGG